MTRRSRIARRRDYNSIVPDLTKYPIEKLLFFVAGIIPGMAALLIFDSAAPGSFAWFFALSFPRLQNEDSSNPAHSVHCGEYAYDLRGVRSGGYRGHNRCRNGEKTLQSGEYILGSAVAR